MRFKAGGLAALMVAVLLPSSALAQNPVNVLQDCWTNRFTANLETENYLFAAGGPVTFVWKHKIMLPCVNYVASIFGFRCQKGKPKPTPATFQFQNIKFGPINPNPQNPELLFSFTGPVPPGMHDWILLVECNDSGNGIALAPDGDIDDECGINLGKPPDNPLGVVLFGPEPLEFLDPDPGGAPPGRAAGDEGVMRPWCFVQQ